MIKSARQVHLEQGTKEWLNWRRGIITATDVAIIMGDNPWKKKQDLFEEKVEGKQPFVSEAMIKGQEKEEEARNWCKEKFQLRFEPKVFLHPFHDWFGCSLDAVNEDNTLAVEIKCGEKSYELACDGIIPEYYKWQMQAQMEVLNLSHMYYLAYKGCRDYVLVTYNRDDFKIEHMLSECKKFHEDHIQSKTSPEINDFECLELCEDENRIRRMELNLENLKRIREKRKDLEKLEDYLEKEIIQDCNGSSVKYKDYKITKTVVKGLVQYKNIECLKDLDLEQYRGPSRIQWKIT